MSHLRLHVLILNDFSLIETSIAFGYGKTFLLYGISFCDAICST